MIPKKKNYTKKKEPGLKPKVTRKKKVRLNKDGTPRKKPVKLNGISKAYAIKNGWLPDITEHWISFAKKMKDLYGFIDMLVCKPSIGIVGVQITTKSNVNARISKINSLESYPIWKASGGLVEVWGWYKDKNEFWQVEITVL